MKPLAPLLLAVVLAACASPEPSPSAPPPASAGAANPEADTAFAQAAAAPFDDLNLDRTPIPPVLIAAQQAPYATPADRSCAALGAAVQVLDAVLGADLDTPSTAANPSLIERGAGDVVRHAGESVTPFRGWVRKLSGAERYEHEVAAAIAAGTVRRAYLKGLGQAAGCRGAAAPRH